MRQLEFPENIQAIVGGKEYSLDNAVLKIWPESEETKGALCVEMEGVGLFTIANYRNLLGGLYRENPVKSRNYEAVKSSKKWENVGNSYIIPALLLYRYSYI